MAIARCEKCGKPTGANVKPPGYSDQPYFPIGHPASGIVCGKRDCENDALIWLKSDEARAYQRGQRIFRIQTHSAKVRVK
jgi:hypothetical protein